MDGIQRLVQMLENYNGKNKKYVKKVGEHLIQHTELNQAFLNEEKNLNDMLQYIEDKAKKRAVNNVAVIEDDDVYKWAINYFIKTNEELKIKTAKTKSVETTKRIENNKEDDEFGSIFDIDSDNQNAEILEQPKKENNQISLFAA